MSRLRVSPIGRIDFVACLAVATLDIGRDSEDKGQVTCE